MILINEANVYELTIRLFFFRNAKLLNLKSFNLLYLSPY